MKLQCTNDAEFGLEIVDYQFPDLKYHPADTDLDWLLIHITGKDGRADWDVVEPCLDVYEARTLCEWFEILADGHDGPLTLPDSGFTEPDLAFDLIASTLESVTIEVRCWHYSVHNDRKRSIRVIFHFEVTRN